MATPAGFEPATTCLEGKCSIQLSYGVGDEPRRVIASLGWRRQSLPRRPMGSGADAVVVQGMEAGGHRGCFDSRLAEMQQVGLFSLVPAPNPRISQPHS